MCTLEWELPLLLVLVVTSATRLWRPYEPAHVGLGVIIRSEAGSIIIFILYLGVFIRFIHYHAETCHSVQLRALRKGMR